MGFKWTESARVGEAEQLCDDPDLSVVQNRSIVPTLFMQKPMFRITL